MSNGLFLKFTMFIALLVVTVYTLLDWGRFHQLVNYPQLVADSPEASNCRLAVKIDAEVTDKSFRAESSLKSEENYLFVRSPEFNGKIAASDNVYAQIKEGDKIQIEEGVCTIHFLKFLPAEVGYQKIILTPAGGN